MLQGVVSCFKPARQVRPSRDRLDRSRLLGWAPPVVYMGGNRSDLRYVPSWFCSAPRARNTASWRPRLRRGAGTASSPASLAPRCVSYECAAPPEPRLPACFAPLCSCKNFQFLPTPGLSAYAPMSPRLLRLA